MAIHTLTLGREPIKKKLYNSMIDQLYELAKIGEVALWNGRLPDQAQIKTVPGITIRLSNSVVPRLELKINPARVLGGTYADLCALTELELSTVSCKVNLILGMIGADFLFEDMSLTRIDCTEDIELSNASDITDLIGCIRRSALGRGYERIAFDCSHKNYQEKNKHSFRAKCKDICLTVYDKSFQLKEEGLMPSEDIPDRRLRFEVAFENASFQRVLNEHLTGTVLNPDLGEKIMYFSNLSVQLLQKYFKIGVMPGRFMRLDLAIAEIDKSGFSLKTKERMKLFIHEVARNYRYGVDGVIGSCGFTAGQVSYLLKCFQDLDLHPAALPLRSKSAQFPGINEMLAGEIPA